MTDFADLAAAREQELRDDALAAHARHGKRHVDASAEHCACCGEPIPDARRQYLPGVQTCIDCQRDIEAHPNRAKKKDKA